MILILSNDSDYSTTVVSDWLDYYKAEYIIINSSMFLNSIKCISGNKFQFNHKLINQDLLKKINVVWFRKWNISNLITNFQLNNSTTDNLHLIKSNLKDEINVIGNVFFNKFKNAFWLDSFNIVSINKIKQMEIAKKCNLDTPETIITSSKNELIKFFNKNNSKIITKAISAPLVLNYSNISYSNYTSKLTIKTINGLPDFFFPSLFQRLIPKSFEIRTFVLNNKIYSMAIFSQSDNQTKIDFRNYNLQKPNRTTPFKLPEEIEERIILFMKKIKLRTGSIDFLKSVDGNYYFLEINPAGQFGMVSDPCNYKIEKEIAHFLIQKDNEKSYSK